MKLVVKAVLYVAFLLLAVMSLQRVRVESSRASLHEQRLARVDPATDGPGTSGAVPVTTVTNEPAADTNVVSGDGLVRPVDAPATTNLDAASGGVAASGGPVAPGKAEVKGSRMGLGIAGFLLGLLGLAGLVGWDLTQWFANRANRALGVEVDAPKGKSAEYEAAEAEWAKGNHLDAITMMREYLSGHPSEQYVALRIAEIYEKDLANYLAAALEYEEILSRNLPREKWGWTALRLSNLYSGRLNQPDKAVGILKRVMDEYPDTAAAKKARERMGVPEPIDEPVGEMEVNPVVPPGDAAGESSDPTLPSGFRRKK